jgi:phosphoribosyl 1,2-cyclic phosphodiesterase
VQPERDTSTSEDAIFGGNIGVTFHGVRGSTPCDHADIARYGGNTSCVAVVVPGHDPVVFDMGTGIRYFGLTQPHDGSFRGHLLLSHLHWDHTQGLPFFTPILCSGSRLDVYGPAQEDGRTIADVLHSTIRPPLFPIAMAELPGKIDCYDVSDSDFVLDSARGRDDARGEGDGVDDDITVKSRLIPHVGSTCGYRVTWRGRSVTYMSDHQMPYDGSMRASDAALELIDGCDLLIHDAQYIQSEFAKKSTWGHCTIDYAVWLAAEAGAKRLALFHHDPLRRDEWLDELARQATDAGARRGVEVFAAAEGQTIKL